MSPDRVTTDPLWLLNQGRDFLSYVPTWRDDDYLRTMVRVAVDLLSDRQRAAVELRIFGCYTYREIAETLGWPGRNYAYSYYKRGIESIRAFLVERGVIEQVYGAGEQLQFDFGSKV